MKWWIYVVVAVSSAAVASLLTLPQALQLFRPAEPHPRYVLVLLTSGPSAVVK